MLFDTIVAPITGLQPAAVAVVRLSGPDSWSIAARLFDRFPSPPRPREAIYGRFSTGDDGLLLLFADGASFTGEQSAELSIHGSPASIRALVEACLAGGARMARAGEFTERAFLNGRIDLTQAEGIRDTIEAATDAQLRQATFHREGRMAAAVRSIESEVLGVLAAVEASVDFSEEIGDLDVPASIERLSAAIHSLDRLLSTAHAGRMLRQGVRIAIVGRPNAGKSTLLNRLLGHERAIVTDIPGTTRDYVEEVAELGGVKLVLVDTAGLRTSADLVETEGIRRARAMIERADAVWYLSEGWSTEDQMEWDAIDRPKLALATKADLRPHELPAQPGIAISAAHGEGLELLTEWVRTFAEHGRALAEPLIAPRHEPLLLAARTSLEEVIEGFRFDMPHDLSSVGLRAALESLGTITGQTRSTDMLERIFADFCIGK